MTTVRLTVPLLYVEFESSGRLDIANGVVLAELTAKEAERIRRYQAYEDPSTPAPLYRLEVHDVEMSEPFLAESDRIATAEIRRLLSLLAVATQVAPTWASIPMDHLVDGVWHRWSVAFSSGGTRPPASRTMWTVDASALSKWGELVENWPSVGLLKRLDLGLDYFYESIVDYARERATWSQSIEPRKSFLSASIALDTLLGESSPGLSHRIALRGSLLTEQGSEARSTFAWLKEWYDARSRLVHEGSLLEGIEMEKVHRYLRKALTSMAHLAKVTAGYPAALKALDEAVFERPQVLDELFHQAGWWRIR